MDIIARRVAAVSGLLLASAALTACASGAGSALPPDAESPAEFSVVAVGTVFDTGGDVRLCGMVLESFPPQCGGEGLSLDGWSWDGLDGAESSGELTWGAYAVSGSYDDGTLTVAGDPVMLALYDVGPSAPADTPLQHELDARYGEGVVRVLPEG